ncbi:MAG TPA: glycosyltransferase, partial [candidate division Zixibacteria bacterium]|nr:glycosyltransferase [candidate division Zixibacteria bacterium]
MNDKKREKVAAVIVSYNRKEPLSECLDAVLRQAYPVEAVYIIDNASTDGTP